MRRNGNFQFDTIEESLVAASPDTASGLAWIIDLSRSAADPVHLLGDILNRSWVSRAQRGSALYARIVETAQAQVALKAGDEQSNARHELWNWQLAWAENLYDQRQTDRAAQVLAQIPSEATNAYLERNCFAGDSPGTALRSNTALALAIDPISGTGSHWIPCGWSPCNCVKRTARFQRAPG